MQTTNPRARVEGQDQGLAMETATKPMSAQTSLVVNRTVVDSTELCLSLGIGIQAESS